MRIFFFWNSSYANSRWTGPAAPGIGAGRLSANSEIAWHYAEALRVAFGRERVISVSMGDRIDRGTSSVNGNPITPRDLCIGHIGPWAEDCHELGLPYIPMVSWPDMMKWPYARFVYHEQHRQVLDRASTIIALCGREVWDRSLHEPLLKKSWRSKAHQMRLGFDRTLFPLVKTTFNPPGQRGFLYVGQVSEQKGTGPMVEVFTRTGYPLFIGNGEWKAGARAGSKIEVLGWVDNADQAFWQALATKADIFLSATLWDCQPVGPLENLSRGFPVLGTPATCISATSPLLEDDLSNLEERVRFWQTAPSAALVQLQQMQLNWLTRISWDQPLTQLVQIIRDHMEA